MLIQHYSISILVDNDWFRIKTQSNDDDGRVSASRSCFLPSAENLIREAAHKIHIFRDMHLKFGRHDC